MTTPLEQIRSAELASARRIEEAKQEADRLIEAARADAKAEIDRAVEAGDREADDRYHAAVAAARAEAQQIEHQATEDIALLQQQVEPEIDRLAAAMLDLVLAPPEERGV